MVEKYGSFGWTIGVVFLSRWSEELHSLDRRWNHDMLCSFHCEILQSFFHEYPGKETCFFFLLQGGITVGSTFGGRELRGIPKERINYMFASSGRGLQSRTHYQRPRTPPEDCPANSSEPMSEFEFSLKAGFEPTTCGWEPPLPTILPKSELGKETCFDTK